MTNSILSTRLISLLGSHKVKNLVMQFAVVAGIIYVSHTLFVNTLRPTSRHGT